MPDLADLVHDHGDGLALEPVVEHVAEERRLAAPEEARDDVDGDVRDTRASDDQRAAPSPSGIGWPRSRSSVGATS